METKKRERSSNFNKSEVQLLTEIVSKYRTIIENKKTDAIKNLRFKYEILKKETKISMAKHRQELYKTGGGPSALPDINEIDEKILATCSNITGLDARSDRIPGVLLEPEQTEILEALPLNTKENNIVVVSEDIPITISHDAPEKCCPMETGEVHHTPKRNNWSSWNSKSLKSKISPCLKPNLKVTKAGVSAKLDELTKARLELVELQKEFANKEHRFAEEEQKCSIYKMMKRERRSCTRYEIDCASAEQWGANTKH